MLLLRLLLVPIVAILALPVLLLNILSLAVIDLLWLAFGRRRPVPPAEFTPPVSLSVVIPSWNARDLLEQFLPSVVEAAAFHPDNEVIVVDNGSDDATSDFLAREFPDVRVLRLEKNVGFGDGNNAGVWVACNRVVVVLNNDMRVEPDCFQRLLDGFADPDVFAVTAQIFFIDKGKRREETGLTEGRFDNGFFQLGHLADDTRGLFPTFYAGGGSTAYDREKYLELGGFDRLFHPFYVEDTDLSYNAWKRGWKVLYQPAAVVHHEHRGTIGKRFSPARIQAILKKNHVLMVWKNVHAWHRLAEHFFFTYAGVVLSVFFPPSPTRTTLRGYVAALAGWPRALHRRWQARSLAVIDDREAMRRPLPAYYRDRFLPHRDTAGRPLNILFVSPYSIWPPTHGGAVFMNAAVRHLARRHRVHVLAFVEDPREAETNLELPAASVQCMLRDFPAARDFLGATPHSVRCFQNLEFERVLHRTVWERDIDVIQLEYTQLGQYALDLHNTAVTLFEHDVYFQTTRRAWPYAQSPEESLVTFFEWLRAVAYELSLCRKLSLVQTCSEHDARLLASFTGSERIRVRGDLRACIDLSRYRPVFTGREPSTVLFVGSFRHAPNVEGLRFLMRDVWPLLRQWRPETVCVVAGSSVTPEVEALCARPGVHLLGSVSDIRTVLERYSLFVVPIFRGSGIRVKMLEAFAAGIPVISTPMGAEGLEVQDGQDLVLARHAGEFISGIIDLLDNPDRAEGLARHARRTAERRWDADVVVGRLEMAYRDLLHEAAGRGAAASAWSAHQRFP